MLRDVPTPYAAIAKSNAELHAARRTSASKVQGNPGNGVSKTANL